MCIRDRFRITFTTPSPDSLRAVNYTLTDLTSDEVLFETGSDFDGLGTGPVGSGLLPIVQTARTVQVDTSGTGFEPNSPTDAQLVVAYEPSVLPINRIRPGYPEDLTIFFYDTVVDTSVADGFTYPATPAKFEVIAMTADGEERLDFRFRDRDGDGTIGRSDELIDVVTYIDSEPGVPKVTWRLKLDTAYPAPTLPPAAGDAWSLSLILPLGADDAFDFATQGQYVDPDKSAEGFSPYVVPNPYLASASFEPERYAISGRGERRIEFRGLPANCEVRIYNVVGDLVQTLQHDGSNDGFVAWDLRTKDLLDVAPGLYIFYVDGGEAGTATGKFAIVK